MKSFSWGSKTDANSGTDGWCGGGPERKSLLTDKISVLLGDTKSGHIFFTICVHFLYDLVELKSCISIFAQGFSSQNCTCPQFEKSSCHRYCIDRQLSVA